MVASAMIIQSDAATTVAAATSGSHDTRLILAAVIGIAVIIGLITFLKLHPFLSLLLGSILVGAIAGVPLAKTVASLIAGFGSTAGSVGTLVALGAIFGKLLADSGGADQIVDTLVGKASARMLPWAMALVGMIIGLPMFFEIGLVLMMPVILLVARRSGQSLMRVGIPALAGLSAMHGFVPPHPGPLAAVNLLNANLGLTLAFGIVVAVPCVIIAGPVFAQVVARWVDPPIPALFGAGEAVPAAAVAGPAGSTSAATSSGGSRSGGARSGGSQSGGTRSGGTRPGGSSTDGMTSGGPGASESAQGRAQITDRRPSFPVTLTTVLVPVVLMLAAAIVEVVDKTGKGAVHDSITFIGTPIVALLIAVVVALFTFGVSIGLPKERLSETVDKALPPIAGILLIVCAGGAFKQVLVDSGIANVISSWVEGSSLSPLFLAWLVAVLLRVSTGSATVATVTTAGILAPVAHTLSNTHLSLLVLAIGAGSLFFSHVNDAGFWLVKSYFGMSVGETLKSWSIMETVLSVVGLILVLALSVIV